MIKSNDSRIRASLVFLANPADSYVFFLFSSSFFTVGNALRSVWGRKSADKVFVHKTAGNRKLDIGHPLRDLFRLMPQAVAQERVIRSHDGSIAEELELVHGQVGQHADRYCPLDVDIASEPARDVEFLLCP